MEKQKEKLINCPKCNHAVSKVARKCPECAHPIGTFGWITGILDWLTESKIIVLLTGILGVNGLWIYDILIAPWAGKRGEEPKKAEIVAVSTIDKSSTKSQETDGSQSVTYSGSKQNTPTVHDTKSIEQNKTDAQTNHQIAVSKTDTQSTPEDVTAKRPIQDKPVTKIVTEPIAIQQPPEKSINQGVNNTPVIQTAVNNSGNQSTPEGVTDKQPIQDKPVTKIVTEPIATQQPPENKPVAKTVTEPIATQQPPGDKSKEDNKASSNSEKSKPLSHKCPKCNGRPYYTCKKCKRGKIDCPKCLGKGIDPCRRCSGRGEIWRGGEYEKCDACNGKGGEKCPQCKGSKTIECPECNGTRRIYYTCPECKGTGYVEIK